MVNFECLIVYTCILLVWLNAPDAPLTDSDAIKTKLITIIIHKHWGAHKQVEEAAAAEYFKDKTLSWWTQLYNISTGSAMDRQGKVIHYDSTTKLRTIGTIFWTFWCPRSTLTPEGTGLSIAKYIDDIWFHSALFSFTQFLVCVMSPFNECVMWCIKDMAWNKQSMVIFYPSISLYDSNIFQVCKRHNRSVFDCLTFQNLWFDMSVL